MLLQFLNWALTVGRLLIIIVETLALGTFLYRFTLDWQISDLKDKIKIQRSIVTTYKTQEDNFRNLQTRLELIKIYDTESANSPRVLNDIIELGKGFITFKSLYVSGGVIRIEAQSPSTAALNTFVNSLKKYPEVATISIDKVENRTSSAEIIVGISAYFTNNSKAASTIMEINKEEKIDGQKPIQ